MEIAVVGSDDFITGFGLAGVKSTFVAEGENLKQEFEKIIQMKEIGVLVMEEKQFGSLDLKTRKMMEKLVRPVVITVSEKGNETDIKEMIKKSIGVDLWK